MNEQKFLSMLGLAMKARKLVSGELAVESAVRAGKVRLLIVAGDASKNAKKKYRDLANYYKVPIFEGLSKTALGIAIGKASRVSIAVIDEGFCKSITKVLMDDNTGE